MNKQIENLIKQAGFPTMRENSTISLSSYDMLERLVLLTAAKCANVCEDLSFTPEGPALEAKYQRNLCSLSIRDTFGVPAENRK
jgi:hypothetical protein